MAQLPERSRDAAGRRAGIGGWLANRPMAVKFLLVIGVTAVVAVAVAVTAMNGMSAMRTDADHLYSNNLVSLSLLDKMQGSALNMRIDVLSSSARSRATTARSTTRWRSTGR